MRPIFGGTQFRGSVGGHATGASKRSGEFEFRGNRGEPVDGVLPAYSRQPFAATPEGAKLSGRTGLELPFQPVV